MFLMRADTLRGEVGSEFFGPQMALALYRLDAISQDPKNSPFSRAQPPPTSPRNVSAHIKNITHRDV